MPEHAKQAIEEEVEEEVPLIDRIDSSDCPIDLPLLFLVFFRA